MSRVITFSTHFPARHPRKGEPTNFVEKIIYSIPHYNTHVLPKEIALRFNYAFYQGAAEPKHHTIRKGKRWKVGDKFSPRIWSGQPYRSKQITIAPDIEIKKVWDFETNGDLFFVNGKEFDVTSSELPLNDGLNTQDFLDWFDWMDIFKGQIICWNENINYGQ